MPMFKSVDSSHSLVPEGEYEVYLHDCGERTTKRTNMPVINFDFVIRADVEQPCKGQHVFKAFFQDKSGRWPEEKIGKYANSLGVEKGADFDLLDLVGRHCVINVTHYEGNDGAMRENIYFTKPSELEPYQLYNAANADGYTEVQDEKLPF